MEIDHSLLDGEEIEKLKNEFLDAIADEKEAASKASFLADQLRENGIDPDDLDSRA